MVFKQIFGWLLLLGGLAIILYCVYSSFNIFTGVNPAPEIFSMEAQDIVTPSGEKNQKIQSKDVQGQMEQMMREQLSVQLKDLLPGNFLPTLFNLLAWSIFAGILIFAGSQTAGLGIKILKF